MLCLTVHLREIINTFFSGFMLECELIGIAVSVGSGYGT